jgi:hypothetical protein
MDNNETLRPVETEGTLTALQRLMADEECTCSAEDVAQVLGWNDLATQQPNRVSRELSGFILDHVHKVPVRKGRFLLVDAVFDDSCEWCEDVYLTLKVARQIKIALLAGDFYGFIGMMARDKSFSLSCLDAATLLRSPMLHLMGPHRPKPGPGIFDYTLAGHIYASDDVAVQGMLELTREFIDTMPLTLAAFFKTRRYIQWAVGSFFGAAADDINDDDGFGGPGGPEEPLTTAHLVTQLQELCDAAAKITPDPLPCLRLMGRGLHDAYRHHALDISGFCACPLGIVLGVLESAEDPERLACLGALLVESLVAGHHPRRMDSVLEVVAFCGLKAESLTASLALACTMHDPAMMELLLNCGANPHLLSGTTPVPVWAMQAFDEWSSLRSAWVQAATGVTCSSPRGVFTPPAPLDTFQLEPYPIKWTSGSFKCRPSDDGSDDGDEGERQEKRQGLWQQAWMFQAHIHDINRERAVSFEALREYLGRHTTKELAYTLYMNLTTVHMEDRLAVVDAFVCDGPAYDQVLAMELVKAVASPKQPVGLMYAVGLLCRGVRYQPFVGIDSHISEFALHLVTSRHRRTVPQKV